MGMEKQGPALIILNWLARSFRIERNMGRASAWR